MPRYSFWQPYEEGEPDPTRWEFQFYPVSEEGHVGQAVPLTPNGVSAEWQQCSAAYLQSECSQRLVKFNGNGFAYPSSEEIAACVQANTTRCRTVDTETPPEGWLSVRACGDPAASCSTWTAITVPEPGVAAALAFGVLGLAAIRSWGSRRTGALPGLREQRQRQSLRGWTREVLGRYVRLVGGRR